MPFSNLFMGWPSYLLRSALQHVILLWPQILTFWRLTQNVITIFQDSNLGIPNPGIPNPGIPAHFLNPESWDWWCFNPEISGLWKMNNMAEFYMIFARKIPFSPNFGAIPGSKAETELTWPQCQLRYQGGHRSRGAIVLNKLFVRLLTLLYRISLDA